ncbi:NADH-quinone oxidoreductase subunit C [Myxococcota bacterium]|nr:NADH-quinone oxidoreductase subunit C [Myxococcota bacterium]
MSEQAEHHPSATLSRVLAVLGDKAVGFHDRLGDDTVAIRPEHLVEVARTLKDDPHLLFDFLMDQTAVDWIEEEPRFELVYHLFSSKYFHRLRLKFRVPESDPSCDSLTPLWGSADWMEREIWDLYGIRFRGHPHLQRILLYDEFEGHPLRKDYPKDAAQPLFEPRYWGSREHEDPRKARGGDLKTL